MRDNKDDPAYGTPEGKDDAAFLVEMRQRYELSGDACSSMYQRAAKHMKFAFVPESQWDDWMKASRTGRPQYEVNKTRQALKQITNDQRQNRPQVKVRAAKNTSVEKAELRQGILRGIEAQSRADNAYDTAMLFQVGGGFGVWRVATDYSDEGSFEQDIKVKEVANPYAVRFDPCAKEQDRRDGRFAFVEEDIPRTEYKARYPKGEISGFESSSSQSLVGWWNDETVRVVEYWYKVPEQREILLLSDGRVVNAADVSEVLDELAAAGVTVVNQRTVTVDAVKQCICSGREILEGPNDWPGKFIPLVPVYGNLVNIEGKEEFCGETAFMEGPQKMHNYERSTFIEVLAQQPISPYFAPVEALEGLEDQYNTMTTSPKPVMTYNLVPQAPNGGKPSREPPPNFPAALAQAAQISGDDIKAVSGKYDASLGQKSNETSGKAILARQKEGDVSSFDYIDNLGKAMLYSAEIISDLLPHIYDTQRMVTVIGEDLKEKLVEVNKMVQDQQTGEWVTVNDLDGHFDFAMTVGPSFTTQRQETAEAMMQMSNDPSPMGMLCKYAFIKSMDAPGMEEVRKGARKMLVGQGMLEPEEGEQPPQPQQPDPKVMADAQLKQAQAGKVQAETAAIAAELQRGPEGQPDQSVDVARLALDAQKAADDKAIREEELRLKWFQAGKAAAAAEQAHALGVAKVHVDAQHHDSDHAHQREMAQFAADNQPSKDR